MENKGFIFVNLLPYREKMKALQIKRFGSLMTAFALTSAFFIVVGHISLSLKIDSQTSRNDFIAKENEKLDENIKSIANLKEEIKSTLVKRKVVESLQVNRADGVNIINAVANNLPDDVYLKSVKKEGNRLTIIGQTTSNNKVSHYMTALDESPIFANPTLIEIKSIVLTPAANAKGKGNQPEIKISEFSIMVEMQKTEEELQMMEEEKKAKMKKQATK